MCKEFFNICLCCCCVVVRPPNKQPKRSPFTSDCTLALTTCGRLAQRVRLQLLYTLRSTQDISAQWVCNYHPTGVRVCT